MQLQYFSRGSRITPLKFVSIAFFTIQLFGSTLSARAPESDTAYKYNDGTVESKTAKDSIPAIAWKPSTSLYLELLGKGWYSVNVDFRKKVKSAMSIGMQYSDGGIWPSIMYYRFHGKNHRFETGGGISGIISLSEGALAMGIHGVLGYRYQKKEGLLFRAGFTPFAGIPFTSEGRFMIVPLVGISLGYSF